MADAHELVSAIKELTAELGKVPTRRAFESKVKGGQYGIGTHFNGSYELLK